METEAALFALAALSQATRLETFRLLVRHEPDGLPAGEIAGQLVVPANTMSAHLGVMSRAGLVVAERRGRSIVYRADLDRLRRLVLFLLADCCGDNADHCETLLKELAPAHA